MNKYTGVLGVFNCQGAAWSSMERKNAFHPTTSEAITGYVRGRDVHLIAEAATDSDWDGECAVYCFHSGEVVTLPYNAMMPVSLKVLEHDIYTVTPVKVLTPGFSFAPLGLINMYNPGGAIERLSYEAKSGFQLSELEIGFEENGNVEREIENRSSELVGIVHLEVKGCGKFGAYSSAKPRRCIVDSQVVDFSYDSLCGLMTFSLDILPEGMRVHDVKVEL